MFLKEIFISAILYMYHVYWCTWSQYTPFWDIVSYDQDKYNVPRTLEKLVRNTGC